MEVSFERPSELTASPGPTGNDGCCAAVGAPHPQQALVPVAAFNDAPRLDQIIMPRLNLVQSTGTLKDSFPQGSIVYAQSLVLFEPPILNLKSGAVEKPGTSPVTITAIKFNPERFIEKVEGGIGGQIFNTEADVIAAGGTLSYKEWELKKASGLRRFGPMADALFAVERPECCADDDTTFIYECDGKKYALALWSLTWTNYTSVAKGCFYTQRAMGCLKNGYPTYSFSLSTRLSPPKNGNRWHQPVVIKNKLSTPAFLSFAASILNSPE